jgi:hypothetical protein
MRTLGMWECIFFLVDIQIYGVMCVFEDDIVIIRGA